jgi:hypothetical protein
MLTRLVLPLKKKQPRVSISTDEKIDLFFVSTK